jgi:hypothetical protein
MDRIRRQLETTTQLSGVVLASFLSICALPCAAAQTFVLPPAACAGGAPAMLHASGFEDSYSARPSNGSGGALADVTRDIQVAGFGVRRFFLQVPVDLNPAEPVPLVVLLHGQAGSAAEVVASFTRSDWGPVVNASRIIVLAPVAHSAQGSWLVPDSFALIQAGIDDTLARYNIDQNRVHGWGFSSGGNTMHALALSHSTQFASYAVHAGSLRRAAGNSAPQQATRKLPVQLWVGAEDSVYLPETEADRMLFLGAGWIESFNLRQQVHTGGHNYDTSQFHMVWQQACPFAVAP